MKNLRSKHETVLTHMGGFVRGLAIASAVLVLSACASNRSPYVPATDEGEVGYSESRIGQDRYRVVYRGDSGIPVEKVQDYALLRAAEITIAQNYDWFEVAQRSSTPELEPRNTARAAVQVSTGTTRQTNCGLLGCTTTESPSTPGFAQSEMDFPAREQSFVASLEILMGQGSHERSANIYEAREVIASIRENF